MVSPRAVDWNRGDGGGPPGFGGTTQVANFTAVAGEVTLMTTATITVVMAPTSPADNQQFGLKNVSADGSSFTLNGNGADVQGSQTWLDNDTTAPVILTDGGMLLWQYNGALGAWILV